MINKLKQIFTSNISLLIIIIGAFSSFVITLIWKSNLSDSFNSYTLLATFISICVSFGLLGMDQVFVRLSKLEDGKNLISRDIIYAIIFSNFLFAFIISSIFFYYYNFNFLSLFLIAVSLNCILFSFNCLRLRYKFIESQIIYNSHKIILFIILLFILNKEFEFSDVLAIFSIALLLISIVILFFFKKWVQVVNTSMPFKGLWLAFLLNIGILTFIGYGDRLLVESLYGPDTMGKYFYYLTVFLFPLNLLQYYIGFKEVVRFKKGLSKNYLYRKLLQVTLLGIFVIIAIYIIILIDNQTYIEVDLKKDMPMIVFLSILGISKLIYGLFSAILGAMGNSGDLYKINLLSLFIILLLFSIIYFFPSLSIEFFVLLMAIIFLSRSAYIYFNLVS